MVGKDERPVGGRPARWYRCVPSHVRTAGVVRDLSNVFAVVKSDGVEDGGGSASCRICEAVVG
eukprot:4449658-Amphidinium_carterae.1